MIQPKSDFVKMQPKAESELCFFIPEQKKAGLFEAVVHMNRQGSKDPYTVGFLFCINVSKN